MSRIVNLLVIGAVAVLAVRQRKAEQKTEKLSRNTGDAFAAVTRHFQSIAKN